MRSSERFVEHLSEPVAILVMGSIGIGACIVSYILYRIGVVVIDGCCNSVPKEQRRRPVFRSGKRDHKGRSLSYLVLVSLCIIIMVYGFYYGASAAGFNFWTTVLSYGFMGIIVTYACATPLGLIGAFFGIRLTDKVEEGWTIRIGDIQGRLSSIHLLHSEIRVWDADAKKWMDVQVPNTMLLTQIVTRINLTNATATATTTSASLSFGAV